MNQQEIIAAIQEQLLSAKGMGKSAENLAGIEEALNIASAGVTPPEHDPTQTTLFDWDDTTTKKLTTDDVREMFVDRWWVDFEVATEYGPEFDVWLESVKDEARNEAANDRGYWKLHAEAFHKGELMGKLDNQDAMIELLGNDDFVYAFWVLADELFHLESDEERAVERAEAKKLIIELIRGTQ